MSRKAILTSLALLSLSACSVMPTSPPYACPLNKNPTAACASMQDAYSASKKMGANSMTGGVQSAFDPAVPQSAAPAGDSVNPYAAGSAPAPAPGATGLPVFKQPKVMRAYVAPYVDAEGNLHSGEYSYFTTPGEWNYGTLKRPGAASGIFEPSRPDAYGFNPVTSQPSRTPPKPAESARPASAAAGPANAAPRGTDPNITQPYQRLSQ